MIDGTVYTVEDTGSGVDGNHLDIYLIHMKKPLTMDVRQKKSTPLSHNIMIQKTASYYEVQSFFRLLLTNPRILCIILSYGHIYYKSVTFINFCNISAVFFNILFYI